MRDAELSGILSLATVDHKYGKGAPVVLDNTQQTEHLTIPSDLKWMPKVVTEIERVARQVGFDEEQGDFIAIATTEAVSNAIIHGNKGDTAKKVHIDFISYPDRLTISVTDEGNGFNPGACEDPTHPHNIPKKSGRGLYIIKTLLDEIDISCSGNGTTIRMTKFKKGISQGGNKDR
jgi:serine/threonine-protein kinase RsbW